MKQLTPIDFTGDSAIIFEALNRMFVRAVEMSRKRHSLIDISISSASVDVIVAFEDYFHDKMNAEECAKRIGKAF